jgi:hypothetical protein
VWQNGTSFALASGTATYVADRWRARRGAAGSTVSRQTGFSGARWCLRFQRDAGDTAVTTNFLSHQIETEVATHLQGKSAVLSFDARKGSDYSSASSAVAVQIITGTGADEAFTIQTPAFVTGTVASTAESLVLSTTAARKIAVAVTIPVDAQEIAIRFQPTWAGTAGTNDYVEITNVKLEEGSATPFESVPAAENMERCLRFYEKSFSLGTAPAQNVGVNTGEECRPAPVAGAVSERLGTVTFKTRKRIAAPTITTYNPAAASAEVRDVTAAANCTATTAANASDRGFKLTCTGAAGTAAGGELAFHWTADARL